MEITQLRYFLEVAETQHITRSAEKLHIAQPALSQSIKRLEESLGVPLFISKGRNIQLTRYGEYLKNKAAPLIADFDAIPVQLKRIAHIDNTTIHINVLAASSLVTEAIIDFKSKHENINFELLQINGNSLSDVNITTDLTGHSSVEDSDTFILNEKIFLAVPSNSELAMRDKVSLSELNDSGFICLSGSRQFRSICDQFCTHANFKQNIIFESDNPSAVRNMIAANMGVGFWPEFTWGGVDRNKVKLIELTDSPFSRDIIITKTHNKIDNKAVCDFFNFLSDFFREKKNDNHNGAPKNDL